MFDFLFKYSPLSFDQGQLLLGRTWPLWIVALIGLCFLALICLTLWRQRASLSVAQLGVVAFLQTSMLAVALLMLLQPMLQVDLSVPQENRIILLVDSSASMRYGNEGQSRIQQVVERFNGTLLERLSAEAEVELRAFDRELHRLTSLSEIPSPGTLTHIPQALDQSLNSARISPLSAVVLISDGADNSHQTDALWFAQLANQNIPVHTVGVGREIIEEDLELTDVTMPSIVSPQQTLNALVTITSGTSTTAQIKLYQGNTVLNTLSVSLQPGRNTLALPFNTGEPGVYDLEFILDALPTETNLINNRQARILQVEKQPKRILYVEGEPRWEYKFLRRAAEEDHSIVVSTLLRTSANKYYRQGIETPDELEEGFPVDRETLFRYDALIIGSFEAAQLTPDQQLNIKEFVDERGGSLLMLGGQRGLADGGWGATAIADILPVELGPSDSRTFVREQVAVQITQEGLRETFLRLDPDPAINLKKWQEIPLIADMQQVGQAKPGAVTLLEATLRGERFPLLIHQRYGRGTSSVLATGGTWRWQMQLPIADMTHELFWRQLLHHLVNDTPARVVLTSDRPNYNDVTQVAVEARLQTHQFEPMLSADINLLAVNQREEAFPVTLLPVENQPGLYRGELNAEMPGDWRLDLSLDDTEMQNNTFVHYFKRADGVAEHFGIAQNRALLERIAQETGGRYWRLDQLDELAEALRFSTAGITQRELLPLWNMPVFFLLLLGLKSIEWMFRLYWRRL